MLNAISNFFNGLIFGALKILAIIVDTIINVMRKLLGLDSIGWDNILIQSLTNHNVINAVIIIIALAFVTMFIFAIIRIIKNYMNDEKDDGALTKSKVVKEILQSIVTIFILPAFCFTLILAVNSTAQVLDNATRNSYDTNYGTEILFSTVDKDSLVGIGKDIYNEKAEYKIYVINADFKDEVLKDNNQELPQTIDTKFLVQVKGLDAVKYYWTGSNYYNENGNLQLNECQQSYDEFTKIVDKDKYFSNFLLPLLGACIMVCTLGMAIVVVGQRIFYSVFLFVISPFIVSTRPVDDGARFKKWSEIFFSKVIGSYAIIICLNVFFMVSADLVAIEFFKDNFLGNSITKIVIYISGVIAATGASQLVAQLIGADAGQAERDSAQNTFRSLAAGGALAKGIVRGAGKVASGVGNFFAGKKNTPLSNYNSASSGVSSLKSDNGLLGDSMASKIGNTLMGRNNVGSVAKAMGNTVANSGIGRFARGVGTLAAGVGVGAYKLATALPKKATRGIQRAYAKKNPNSKTAQKLAIADKRAMQMKRIKSHTTPQSRQKLFNVAKKLGKKVGKDNK